jgi:hypothetical protein
LSEVILREAPETQHFVDYDGGRQFSARQMKNPRVPIRLRSTRSEESLQVDNRQELATNAGDAAQPGFGAWDTRHLLGKWQYFTDVRPRRDEILAT